MAGKRHHIIPKFLQKGFASREEGDTVWTWLYHKSIPEPQEISTTDAIVSRHFYGKGEEGADKEITDFETTKLAPLVDALRAGSSEPDDVREEIAGLVVHLSIRTKLIRKGLEEAPQKFLSAIGEIFGDGELIGNAVANQSDSYIREQIDEVLSEPVFYPGADEAIRQFEEKGISRTDVSSIIVALMRVQFDDPGTREDMNESIANIFNQIFNPPGSVVSDSIKAGHIAGLKQSVAPDARIQRFEQFAWNIQDCDFDLILGDSATIFEAARHKTFVPYCDLDDITAVLLPISARQLLIGSRNPNIQICVTSNINQAFARCSFEQFVGSSNVHADLIGRIALDRMPISDAGIDAEINEIREYMKRLADGPGSSE